MAGHSIAGNRLTDAEHRLGHRFLGEIEGIQRQRLEAEARLGSGSGNSPAATALSRKARMASSRAATVADGASGSGIKRAWPTFRPHKKRAASETDAA